MRLGQPYSSPINEISRGLVPALISNIAQDTKGDKKYAPTNPLQQIEANIPGLQKLVPLAKPKGGSSSSSKPWYERTTRSSSGKPWYEK
jgi:hypothetical protein